MSSLLPLVLSGEPGWTPSNYMPAFKVEVAFTSGYNTPAADRVWTDVSEWVELDRGMGITFGRQDEIQVAGANILRLTLDNSDGRFTAGRSASPYYPNVRLGRPIRVSAMTVTGHTSVRFVGFVDQWPTAWDDTDAYAYAQVTASSRLARVGLTAKLRSMIEQEILAASPTAYYPLGDPSGSTSASDSSGNQARPLAPYNPTGTLSAPVFGEATGPGTDGLTALHYPAGGGSNRYPLRADVDAGQALQTLRVAATLSASGGDAIRLAEAGFGTTLSLFASSTNVVTAQLVSGGIVVGSATSGALAAGSYDIIATCTAANGLKLYVDGSLAGSGTGADLTLGYIQGGGNSVRESVLSHLAAFATELTTTQIASQAEAIADGFAGERTDERILRLLGWVGVSSSEVTTDTGVETMTYQLTSGQSVVDALRDAESTESGILYDRADGNVGFRNRSHRYTASVAATFDMEAQHVGSDYAPKLDRSTLVNDVEVSNPTTGESARWVDTASSDEYGVATGSARSVADSYDPLIQKASWLIASYAEPRPRVPSLTVDVLAHVGATPSAETILGLTVSSRIQVTNQPTQADATDADYFVEGYTETIGPESYQITFNLSPTYPYLNVVVLDDPDRGLDSGSILAL